MAQFRGTIQGSRGGASRLGGKESGLNGSCNGWGIGVSFNAYHNKETGKDKIGISVTGGSGHGDKKERKVTYNAENETLTIEEL